MSAQPVLRLNLLGSAWIGQNDIIVKGIESDKTRALLIYVVVESNRAHSRQALAALFWPDTDERTALQNLRQAIYNVRQAIGDQSAGQPHLLPTRQSIQFNLFSPHEVDVVTFSSCLDAVQRHPHTQIGACPACASLLKRAVELYLGDFLEGFSLPDCDEFESWLQGYREHLRAQALQALAQLASYHAYHRDYELAERYYRRQVEIAPWHEEAHRGIMTMLALRGQTAAAIHHYSVLQAAVAEAYETDPLPESDALLNRIRQGQLQPEPEKTANPYKGLQAFSQQDADQFFGRETVTQRLLKMVLTQPCVFVIGASGSGKSSVIHAGLLPMLYASRLSQRMVEGQAGGDVPVASEVEWLAVSFRPGSDPFLSLATALGPHLQPASEAGAGWTTTLAARLRSGESSLIELAQTISDRPVQPRRRTRLPSRLLVVVDHFEELYTLCNDATECQAFIDLLLMRPVEPASPAESSSPVDLFRVLISLRADFAGQAISYRPLADAIQGRGLVLGPMNRDELRQAIVEPARRQGALFESGLVERLLDDVGKEPGNLPLLQFALTLLWESRKNGSLTHLDYEEIGGVAGALAHYADGVMETFDEAEREQARRLFLRMVQPGHDAPDTRGIVTREMLGDEDWRLVQRLADTRLLVTDERAGQEVAEVAHEALIRSWGQLRAWLEADRQFHSWHFQFRSALEQWLDSQLDASLLLRGPQLVQAENWMSERGDDLNPHERAFIAAGLKERDRIAAEQEAQHQRELAQAHALANAEHQRAETEIRVTRRLRLLAAILAVSLLMVLVVALLAWKLARESQHQTQLATAAQQTAKEAQAQALAQASLAKDQAQLAESERAHAEEQTAVAQAEHTRAEAAAQRALSRQLGAQATGLLADQPDLGLLLALESARIATAADKADLLLSLDINPLLTRLLHAETTPVHQAEFLATDGPASSLLVSSAEGSLRVWDIASGQAISQPMTLPDTRFAALSPDGRRAATTDGSQLTLWDVQTGQPVAPAFTDHPGEIDFLTFAVDGSRLVSGSRDGTLILRAAEDGELLKTVSYDGSGGMALGPRGALLAMFDDFDGKSGLELWDMATGQQIAGPVFGHTTAIQSLNYSRDGSLLVTASADKTLRLWDGKTLEPVGKPLIGHSARVLTAAFSPDNRVLASGGTDNQIILWDVASGEPLGPPLTGHDNWVRDVTFSPAGSSLVSTDASGAIALWDLSAHQTLRGHADNARGVVVTPDNQTLISSSYDRSLKWWDAVSGDLLTTVESPHQSSIIKLALSPDGTVAATGDVNGVICLWDVKTRSLLRPPIQSHPAVIVSLAFSPDSRILASGDFDGTITLWDLVTNQPLVESFKAHDGWTLSLAFSPDGKLLASGSNNAEIKLWQLPPRRLAAGEPLTMVGQPLTGHTNWVTSLLFWADGKRLLSGSGDHTIRQWDVASQQPVGAPLIGHTAQVWDLQVYPPDGSGGEDVLASMGGDGTVIFWDMNQGRPIAPPLHTNTESDAHTISPDGTRLYEGAFSSMVELWRLSPVAWEDRACAIANRNLSPEEWERFLGDEPYRETCPGVSEEAEQ